ncbi:CPBP family intramembrane metalloprotease [Ramlibacter sp. XY19]|uniref:CPBP family intramembrane glutamic endopeptidase n=1 Tax=Ramlibacter paludis TaxID=2908000 RepID=UPI0023DC7A7F|nr:CPBP family intramembrane glutamic endopeptidase [Ramlibacter paludis]MCG2594028.1 CPBP family intramembrane metalloprotease [Ramlibacter paludis]
MAPTLARRQALLAAIFPFAALALLNGFYKLPLHRVGPAWYWAADALQFVLVPVICVWWLLRPAGVDAQALGLGLGLRRGRHGRQEDWASLLFVAVVIFAITWPIVFMARRFGWEYADVLPDILPTAWGARLLVAVYMAVTAALVEEVAFRALPWLYVREVLAERWRAPVYLVGSTFLFALIHAEQGPAGMISSGWFGFVAAAYYLRLRSLWPPVLAHFAVDLWAFGPW